ncbi:hypothetical protein MNBD_PLANCTO03-2042 [hydrothermal vent metagenome]|uniref:ABC-2 type transporter domain-containing protein n=1 Tax=hydrothermal vent metagenome TaxID=652676 RepID=A0A3B1E724_9ZZZZ
MSEPPDDTLRDDGDEPVDSLHTGQEAGRADDLVKDETGETPAPLSAQDVVSMDVILEKLEASAGRGSSPDLDLFGRPAPKGHDWSHRRGEPRIFAFFWTLYLLFATVTAFWSVGSPGSHDPLALRPAARAVLATITVGIALLWPMTRLSQEVPTRRVRHVSRMVGQDLIVLLVPAQAIIWPQIAMAAWPMSVVAALACALTVWGVLVGALLTIALVYSGERRGWWMLVFVAIAGFGPLLALGPGGVAMRGDDSFDWWWMTSPITTGFEIARDRPWTGASAAVAEGHWWSIGVVGVFGILAWGFVAGMGLFRRADPA